VGKTHRERKCERERDREVRDTSGSLVTRATFFRALAIAWIVVV
jgi:hypothetical protein